ncbi:YezD family protein [Sutcliffiella cohnii]|uniref:YezD family protein n=1 Tax=Sutcliffiella cohnii TaxID=33932 RepID=UPI002E245207|nr:YezD family protein [Sutcliffiella cohnii]
MAKLEESKVKHILSTLESLEYGTIEVTVHNGQITQIDTTEKKRFSLQQTTPSKSQRTYKNSK